MSRRQWASPDLRRSFNAKSRVLRLETGRRELPFDVSCFRHVTDDDLTDFLSRLGKTTTNPFQYWARIFAEINCHLIDERKIVKGQQLLRFLNENVPSQIQGGFLLLYSWFRLSEYDEVTRVRELPDRSSEMGDRIKSAKRHARSLHRHISLVCSGMDGLSEDLEGFFAEDGEAFGAVDTLKDPTIRDALMSVSRLAEHVKQLRLTKTPALMQEVDKKMYAGASSREFDYSVDEKKALLAMYDLLRKSQFTKTAAANTIASVWDIVGPMRDPWIAGDRKQSLRRALDRWEQTGQ